MRRRWWPWILAPMVLTLAGVGAGAGAGAGASSPPVPPPSFFDQLRDARARMARGDLETARRDFARLDSMAGGLPSTTYALAQIAGRQGDRSRALRYLRAYAAMGLWRPAARDSSFAAFATDTAFAAVTAAFERNLRPIERATLERRLEDASLLAEDIAYDAMSRTFYVSSIHRGKVVAIDSTGAAGDFVPDGAEPGRGIFALALDRKSGRLWGTVVATPTAAGYDPADSGRAGLVAWDLLTGEPRARVELPFDGAPHVLGDMTLGPDGSLYVTDSVAGALDGLRPGAPTLDLLAPPGTFGSPQTPVVVETGKRLWIADYPRGLVEFDLLRRRVRPVPKPPTAALAGIDGMALMSRGNVLLAIQNGTQPIRVLALTLDPARRRVTGARVLERASALMGEPNHGVVVGDDFMMIGNSGWDRVNREEELETPDGSTAPAILRLRIAGDPAPGSDQSP